MEHTGNMGALLQIAPAHLCALLGNDQYYVPFDGRAGPVCPGLSRSKGTILAFFLILEIFFFQWAKIYLRQTGLAY